MTQYTYRTLRNKLGCSRVYPRQSTQTRGKRSLGEVCWKGEQYQAQVAVTPGADVVTGLGRTRDKAVGDALASTAAHLPPTHPLRTLREVADMTGIPLRTLTNWVARGWIKDRSQTSIHQVRCVDVRAAARISPVSQHYEGAKKCH